LKNWNIVLNNSVILPDSDTYAKCMAMNYETSKLYIGTKSGRIHIYDMKNNDFVSTVFGHTGSVRSLCYFSDGRTIISGGDDGKLIKWDTVDGSKEEFIRKDYSKIRGIISIFDGEKIYVASGTVIETYNVFTMKEEPNTEISLNEIVTNIMWYKDSKFLVAGLNNGEVIFVNPRTRSVIQQFNDHKEKITGLTFCNYFGKNAVATSSKDNSINIYGLDENRAIYNTESFNKKLFPKNLTYCFDEKSLITTHEDGKLFIFDYTKRNKKKYFFAKNSPISCCFYTGDSSTLIVGNENSEIDFFISKV